MLGIKANASLMTYYLFIFRYKTSSHSNIKDLFLGYTIFSRALKQSVCLQWGSQLKLLMLERRNISVQDRLLCMNGDLNSKQSDITWLLSKYTLVVIQVHIVTAMLFR